MGLQIHLFSSAKEMWQHAQDTWQELDATLLFPGEFARSLFADSLQETVWGEERIKTLPELWKELEGEVKGLPEELSPAVWEPVLADNIAHLPKLSKLLESERGLTDLAIHLDAIERQADRSYRATDEVQEEIVLLRKTLADEGFIFQGGIRALLARESKNFSLTRPLVSLPLPETSRHLAGLLKGLARKNDIFYHLLLPPALLDGYLEETGLEGEIIEHGKGSSLFAKQVPEKEQSVLWIYAEDQIAAALHEIRDKIEAGEEARNIAVVIPELEQNVERFYLEAGLSSVPVLFRWSFSCRETVVGSLLLRLAESDLSPEAWREAGDDLLEPFVLPDKRDELLQARKEGREADVLLRLAEEIIDNTKGLPDAREVAWLVGLRSKLEQLRERKIKPWNLPLFLADTTSSRVQRGTRDGVLLISPAEAASLKIKHLLFLQLDAEVFPAQEVRSPFLSSKLLALLPELGARDTRPLFASAVLSAQESITFFCSAEDEPSAFWLETKRIFEGEEKTVYKENTSLPRHALRGLARRQEMIHASIENALENLGRESLPEIFAGWQRRGYSVTELENYLRCPYGWFVEKVIRPKEPDTVQQKRGTILHKTMQRIMELPIEDRYSSVTGILRETEDGFFGETDFKNYVRRLEDITGKYCSEDWPFDEHYLEKRLERRYPADGETVHVLGYPDRVDIQETDEGKKAIIIDYKTNRPTEKEEHRLQPVLYPALAEACFPGVEAVGFLYISLRSNSHEGYLAHPLPGVSSEGINFDWQHLVSEGKKRAGRAIAGIEGGHWSETGEDCPSWCGHYLLSETGGIS